MTGRFIDIASNDLHLSVDRGFMKLARHGDTIGQTPLDDIAAVLVHGHGITVSMNLTAQLAQRNAALVLCDHRHNPVSWMLPVSGHHDQGRRMQAQSEVALPKRKRIWRDLVKAKIRAQGQALDQVGASGGALRDLAKRVKSGDPDNLEAQAAKRYWRSLLGPDFRRHDGVSVENSLLNYGYTVLRAATARAILGAGLHPSLSVHHKSGGDALCLSDDLMEPFRPYVDLIVHQLVRQGSDTVGRMEKQTLGALTVLDLEGPRGTMPLMTGLERLALSLARIYLGESQMLELPGPPLELSLSTFVSQHTQT